MAQKLILIEVFIADLAHTAFSYLPVFYFFSK